MHLNEVEVLLKYLGFLSSLVNNIDFVTKNNYGNAKINFQDTLTQRHIQSHINFLFTIGISIIASRLELLRMLYNQVTLIIKLWLFVGLYVSHNFLLHLFMDPMSQVWSHSENAFAQRCKPSPQIIHYLHRFIEVKTDDGCSAF